MDPGACNFANDFEIFMKRRIQDNNGQFSIVHLRQAPWRKLVLGYWKFEWIIYDYLFTLIVIVTTYEWITREKPGIEPAWPQSQVHNRALRQL